jgi:hypothetical protein
MPILCPNNVEKYTVDILPKYNGHESNTSFTSFEVSYIDRNERKLLRDFTYFDEEFGPIVVPKEFKTDFATIGALKNVLLFGLYALLAGYGDRSATVHDYLYVNKGTSDQNIDRKKADEIFYRALRSEGIARWRAGIFFLGVRVFGGFYWK